MDAIQSIAYIALVGSMVGVLGGAGYWIVHETLHPTPHVPDPAESRFAGRYGAVMCALVLVALIAYLCVPNKSSVGFGGTSVLAP